MTDLDMASPKRPASHGVLRIGALRVDPAVDEIEREGRIVKLEPRVMQLLLCLANHAGDVVSVEQLLAEVWSDVVVTPDSVYQAVAGLRRVLGDDPKKPTYIANVVRRGYRLVAPVAPWLDPPGIGPAADTVVPLLPAAPNPVPANSPLPKFVPPASMPLAAVPPIGSDAGVAREVSKGGTRRQVTLGKTLAVLGIAALLIVGFGITWHLWQPARSAAPSAPSVVVQDASVAVLPFRDLSERHDQEFFADGLTEEIIDLLANVPSLRVPARTSAFYFKGKPTDIREIAKVLGVAHVLEGSVRRSGSHLRVTATLARADNGYQVWTQTYELGENNFFAIQDDIAAGVVRSLEAIILPPKPRDGAAQPTLEAYSAMLRARFLLNHESDVDNREAVTVLQRAIVIAPAFAAAWGELARAHLDRASYFDETPNEDMERARAEAHKALSLDVNCVEAHDVLADIELIYDFDPVSSQREDAALRAADPGKPLHDAYPFYSGCVLGPCYEQVIRDTDEQIANDPLNPSPYSTQALARYVFGDLTQAEANVRHAIALSPESGYRRYLLARILFARHDPAQLQDMTKLAPESLYDRAALVLAYQALGRSRESDAVLRDLLTHDSKEGAYQIAEVYAARGQLGDAMTWLEQAYALHDAGLWILQVDPLFRPLADDPRLRALRAKLHM